MITSYLSLGFRILVALGLGIKPKVSVICTASALPLSSFPQTAFFTSLIEVIL